MEIVKTYLVGSVERNGPESFISYKKVIQLEDGSFFLITSNRGDDYYEKIPENKFQQMKKVLENTIKS